MLGRSQLSAVPLIGVLLVPFAVFSRMLTFETIHVPRKLDEISCPPPEPCSKPRIRLHADGSVDAGIAGETPTVFEARHLSRALASLEAPPCDVHSDPDTLEPKLQVIEIAVDDGVRWGDFVASVSSVSHITGAQVVVVSEEQ